MKRCWKTGVDKKLCGHCRYPELYLIAEQIARETKAKCSERTSTVESEMPHNARFVLETVIQILKESV